MILGDLLSVFIPEYEHVKVNARDKHFNKLEAVYNRPEEWNRSRFKNWNVIAFYQVADQLTVCVVEGSGN